MKKKDVTTVRRTFKSLLVLCITSILLPILGESLAYADPPPWAPAHGYRNKHHQDGRHGDRDDEDEDDDRRGVNVVPVQPVYVAPYGIAQGTCNRKLLGQVLGGAAGAAVGSQIGGGRGNTAAIIGGSILGVIVGGNIGQSMDRVDQGCVGQILEHASDGRQVAWTDPNNGGQYQVRPDKPFKNRDGQYCRQYLTTAVIDGYPQQVRGTACRQPNGTWQMVN